MQIKIDTKNCLTIIPLKDKWFLSLATKSVINSMPLELSLQLWKTCQRHIRINKFPIASSDLTRFLLLFLQYFKHLSKVRATGLQLVKWWLDRWIIIEEFTGRAHSYYYLAALSAPSLSRLSITDDSVKYTLGKLQGAKIYLKTPYLYNFVFILIFSDKNSDFI